ncbi:hypothetical protein JNUCC0626_15450 [Lentzea sp. JNUCC 0626]|uniref:hypothetical protein n=1 Tax=Lentzea sp. JNUCC 0626 TaxID=3367513 RepID=UPI003747B5FB
MERPEPEPIENVVDHDVHGLFIQIGKVSRGETPVPEKGLWWPALVVLVCGTALAGFGCIGLLDVQHHLDPLPSGTTLGTLYVMALIVGAVLLAIGTVMSRTRPTTWIQVVGLILFAALVAGLALTALVPGFSP